MLFKYSLILLLGFCCSVSVAITEENLRELFEAIVTKCEKQCKHLITPENLQDLKDDFETDNEDTRSFEFCLAHHVGYINNLMIHVSRILEDLKKYAPGTTPNEIAVAKKILNICKDEGEREKDAKDIVGKFIKCLIDRFKSGL